MRNRTRIALTLIVLAAAPHAARAQTVTTIYTFQGGADGQLPEGGVTLGPDNRLYGTTYYGGAFGGVYGPGGGEIFALAPPGRGAAAWTKTALANFYGATMGANCATPIIAGAGVAGYAPASPPRFDKAGNLYAAASQSGCDEGTVVALAPTGLPGGYTVSNVLQFQLGYPARGDTRGNDPQDWGGLIFDTAGNIYGTTVGDGSNGAGELFRLSPGLAGNTVTQLISFATAGTLGDGPQTGVVADGAGNLYGTTSGSFSGGPPNQKVYEYLANGTTAVLHVFASATGINPGPLVLHAGHLFGTAGSGGTAPTGTSPASGVVYELAPNRHGGWTYTVLHSFTGADGQSPFALVFGPHGVIYGNAQGGGAGGGTLFKLTPPTTKGGAWAETTLWTFTNAGDGYAPSGSLAMTKGGVVYGTTAHGGAGGFGTVFKLTE